VRPGAAIDPRATAPFRPRWPWLGGDLQTVRNLIVRPRPSFADAPPATLAFPMADGSGDVLIGYRHEPGGRARSLVVLIHGLTGCAESYYVLATARHLLDRGHAVLRLNLRGAGASAGRCREQYHAGRTADLRAVLDVLTCERVGGRLFAVGYSLGGNALLKLLGEDGTATPLAAAAAVSAPIDLAAAAACMRRPRNRLYERYLLRRMKAEARASRGGLAANLDAAARAAATIVAFDDGVVAPRYGFASAADYYARCSSAAYLGAIAAPTLVMHAADDPWIPCAAYRALPWSDLPRLTPIIAAGGGHVGFHGAGSRTAGHDRAIGDFLAAIG
jgi:hypothetical protein